MTDEQLIRAAILDVIDGGNKCSTNCDMKHEWMFPTERFAGDDPPTAADVEMRMRFCDAVVVRIQQLRQLDDAAEANQVR